MNKVRTISFLLALSVIFVGLGSKASAQFEGHIEMKTYSDDEKGNIEENFLNMYVTTDRIMIKGEENFDFAENMSAEGLLIRNDNKDFVILVGKNKGLQVTKEEIESLVGMFSGWGDDAAKDKTEKTDLGYSFTDRTKTVLGYECAEMILENEDKPENYLSVWLTPGIDINWGMLAEPWKNMPESVDKEINGMPREILFKGKNFPMQIEVHENGKVQTIMEVTKIEESNIAKAMVQVPADITLVSAKEYMFQMMMEQ